MFCFNALSSPREADFFTKAYWYFKMKIHFLYREPYFCQKHAFSRPIFSRSEKATEPHRRRRSKPTKKQRKRIRSKAQVSKMSEWSSNAKGAEIQRKQTKPCSYPTSDAGQQHTPIRQNRTGNKSAPQCRRTPISKKRRKLPASSKTLIFQGLPPLTDFLTKIACGSGRGGSVGC